MGWAIFGVIEALELDFEEDVLPLLFFEVLDFFNPVEESMSGLTL